MRAVIDPRISGNDLRVSDLLEQFRVAAFVWMQSQSPVIKGLVTMGWLPKHIRYTLFAVGFFELSFACIRQNLEQFVVFPE